MNIAHVRQHIGNAWKSITLCLDPEIFVIMVVLITRALLVLSAMLRGIIRCSIQVAMFLLIAGPLLLAWYDFDLLRHAVANANASQLSANSVRRFLTGYFFVSVAGGMIMWVVKCGHDSLARWVDKSEQMYSKAP